jgi:hypothetical protein
MGKGSEAVSATERSTIAAVVRAKGHSINRGFLEKIDDHEVHVQKTLSDGRKYICRIRGMCYCVCLDSGNPSIATFEPSLYGSKTGCRVIGHGGVGQVNRP